MKKLTAHWRSVQPELRVLYLSTILLGLGYNAFYGLLSPFFRAEGVPVETIGFIFSAMTFAGAVAALAGGFAADRLGPLPLIVTGRLCVLIGLGVLLGGRSLPFVVVSALAWGLAAVAGPAESALLARHTTVHNRATALALWETFGMAANAVSPVAGGLLADRRGPRATFGAAVPFIATSALVLSRLSRSSAASSPKSMATGGTGLTRLYRGRHRRAVLGAMLLWLVIGVEMGLLRPARGLWLVDAFGASWSGVGLAGTFTSLAGIAAALVGGVVADRHGRIPITVGSFALGAVAMAAVPWAPRLELAYAAFFLLALVLNLNGPALGALTLEAVPEAYRGRFVGLTGTLMMLGMAAGSAPLGWLYGKARWLPFATCAGLELVSALIVLLALRSGLPDDCPEG